MERKRKTRHSQMNELVIWVKSEKKELQNII